MGVVKRHGHKKLNKKIINLLKFGAAGEIFWMFNVPQLFQKFFKILGNFVQNTPPGSPDR